MSRVDRRGVAIQVSDAAPGGYLDQRARVQKRAARTMDQALALPRVYDRATPAALAEAFLREPVSPARVRQFVRRLAGQPAVYIAQTLRAIPDAAVRAAIAAAVKDAGLFVE